MRSRLTKKWLIKKKIKQGKRKRLKKIQLGRQWLKKYKQGNRKRLKKSQRKESGTEKYQQGV